MNQNRIIGIILLVIGAALLIIGINSSHSVADQLSDTFRGRFTQATTWYILGGIGAGALGVLLLLTGSRSKTT